MQLLKFLEESCPRGTVSDVLQRYGGLTLLCTLLLHACTLSFIPQPSLFIAIHSNSLQAGFTPLHMAAIHGNVEVMQLLLDHQADVNARNKVYKWTPLHMAVKDEQKEAVVALLAAKADVNATAKVSAAAPEWNCPLRPLGHWIRWKRMQCSRFFNSWAAASQVLAGWM